MDSLLQQFASIFRGQPYLHRRPHTGDWIAAHLYEDLMSLGRSRKFGERAADRQIVVNVPNRIYGRAGRRGDGTLGVLSPTGTTTNQPGFRVARGPVATLEIGTEVKIIATKMTAQIDRVRSDLQNQAGIFRNQSSRAICVGIVGVNFAESYVGHEGNRRHVAVYPPAREAPEIVRRLNESVRSSFTEFLILPFRATNSPPYQFEWVNEKETRLEYGSALVRIADEYDLRF